MIVLTLRRSLQLNNLKQTTPLPCVIIVTLINVPKEKRKKRGGQKKYDKIKINKKNEKSGRNFPYESSLGGIRLMTSPCIRARQELSKKILDGVGNTYKFSKCYFTWLKCKETINSVW